MTVPALDTSFIGTFGYTQPATEVQLADVLPYLLSYQQFAQYVDGVYRQYDDNSSPGKYTDVYVRIRTDGWMMAFFPEDAEVGLACWGEYPWILDEYENRGNLVYWDHEPTSIANPPTDHTTLFKALYNLWNVMKANSDNPSYTLITGDMGYYDYEYPTANALYIVGKSVTMISSLGPVYAYNYFTVPISVTLHDLHTNHNYSLKTGNTTTYRAYIEAWINPDTAKEHKFMDDISPGTAAHAINTSEFIKTNLLSYVQDPGTQNEIKLKAHGTGNTANIYTYAAVALVLLVTE